MLFSRFRASAAIIGIALVLMPALATAQEKPDEYGLETAVVQTGGLLRPTVAGQSTVEGVIGEIVKALLGFTGIIFFGLMLYAGFTWMRAFGNTEYVERAKSILEAAVIGLLLVLAAYAIATFVFESLTKGAGSTAGGGTSTALACTAGRVDGAECGDNKVCDCGLEQGAACTSAGTCVDLCQYNFSDKNGVCTDVSGSGGACPGSKIKETGLCPGSANNVCCHD